MDIFNIHKKIKAAREGDMSQFESQKEYEQYKQQADLLDPSNFMGMGSTRAVRELGPTMGKMMNKLGTISKVEDNNVQHLPKYFKDQIDFAKFRKFEGEGKIAPGELDNIKYLQKQLGGNYESLKNSRNFNDNTNWEQLLEKGMDAQGYPMKEYGNLEKTAIAEQDIIGEAGYSKLRQLLNNVRKATGE